MNAQKLAVAAGLVVLGVGAVWLWRRGVAGVAEDVAAGAAKVASGAVTGMVKGAANIVGIPDTDMAKCRQAIAEGRLWDASFACPASDFLAAGGSMFFSWFQPKARSNQQYVWSDASAAKDFADQESLFGR